MATNTDWLEQTPEGVILRCHIQPGAKSCGFSGVHGDRLKIRISASPHDGKANRMLEKHLSEQFKVPTGNVQILKGKNSRTKCVMIRGSNAIPKIPGLPDTMRRS